MNISSLPLRCGLVVMAALSVSACTIRYPGRVARALDVPTCVRGAPEGWNIGHSARNEEHQVLELVRDGETVDTWTRLLSLSVHRADGPGTHRRMVQHLASSSPDGCRVGRVVDGVEGDIILDVEFRCETPPQNILMRVVDAGATVRTVQYATRSTPLVERAAWVELLRTIELGYGTAACTPPLEGSDELASR